MFSKGHPLRLKDNVLLLTPACVQMNATGAEYSWKSINIPPALMADIVVIYKSHPTECAECCVTIPNNHTDARNDPQLFSQLRHQKIEHDFNYKLNNSWFQDGKETLAS